MKKTLLLLLCLLVFRLQAAPIADPTEPVGQRFGMSLLEVLDSVDAEGIYHYDGPSRKTANGSVYIHFKDSSGDQFLTYSFTADKCDLAMLILPLTELDTTVQRYDRQFPSIGKQMWRTPYGRIKVSVAIGAESMRKDHKPHLTILFDPAG